MSLAKETKRCPFCREVIQASATRCRHCHADLSPAKPGKSRLTRKINTFRTGFLSGVAFSLIIALLAYLQFWAD